VAAPALMTTLIKSPQTCSLKVPTLRGYACSRRLPAGHAKNRTVVQTGEVRCGAHEPSRPTP